MKQREDKYGQCWLCGTLGPLTEEHIPPRSAFNEYPLLLQEISEVTKATGRLVWRDGPVHERGFAVMSLCGPCNGLRGGRSFAPSYANFIKELAERVKDVSIKRQLTIQKIKKPQLVLRQIVFQFVSANGPAFARANDWVEPFLRVGTTNSLPEDVWIYVFAVNKPCFKTTGLTGYVQAGNGGVRVLSEFTCWPLGTVLSYGELPHQGLTPIQSWSKIPFRANETRDLTLWVNPLISPYPVDFRSDEDIFRDIGRHAGVFPSRADAEKIPSEVKKRGGLFGDESTIYLGHPNLLKHMRENGE